MVRVTWREVGDAFGLRLVSGRETEKVVFAEDSSGQAYVLKAYSLRFPVDRLHHLLTHVRANGFRRTITLLLTQDGKPYWEAGGQRWVVMPRLPGRPAVYENERELARVAETLAAFHRAAVHAWSLRRGSDVPYLSRLTERYWEYLSAYRQASAQPGKSPIARWIAETGAVILREAEAGLAYLPVPALIAYSQRDVGLFGAVAHHDVARHNFLVNGPIVYLLDLDASGTDWQAGDLVQLISRALWDAQWRPDVALVATAAYERVRPLDPGERRLIPYLLRFPSDEMREALGVWRGIKGYSPSRSLAFLRRAWQLRSRRAECLAHLFRLWTGEVQPPRHL
ncbi:protein kinase family protein [Calditerricola satsumensis]|uniref:Aminoglycoside phosphotransferase domain-containing protein n=1 Tax=Calditerricola satsumensis TaxID=373054 RepID=A0A8J3BCZ7_9BACI|nr:hypothetical protein [Calditerricola satsumensis]GGK01653.1 hypothetical protein GCM10007043_14670 [Calditerricola satsumensis]